MSQEYDLVVLGTGSGGSTVAYKCRKAGWRVAIVDCRPFGGTCQLRGCDPKKVLIGAAHLIDWRRRMDGKGVVGDLQIDWAQLIAFKRTFTDAPPEENDKSFQNAGIDTYHGTARFLDAHTLTIDDTTTLYAKHIVIATGARPRTLNIVGEHLLTDSIQFLELEQLPKRILFVGGGFVSFEFAHLAQRAGSTVTIVHRGERPLEQFDADLVGHLVEVSRAAGINILLERQVTGISQTEDGLRVTVEHEGEVEELVADLVVHGAGRIAELDALNVDEIGLAYSERGVTVNQYLQSTSHDHIYAAGDSADSDGLPLTPVAASEGYVVASNLLKGNQRTADYRGTGTAVFTLPQLAMVGLTEAEAERRGLDYTVKHETTTGWYASRRTNEPLTAYKTIVEKGSGRILGAHLLGEEASEVINLFVLAIRHGIRAHDLRTTIYAYPTKGSDVSYMV